MNSFSSISHDEYQMCSEPTKQQAEILVDLYNAGLNDTRTRYYYPLIDNLIEWIDTKYKPSA